MTSRRRVSGHMPQTAADADVDMNNSKGVESAVKVAEDGAKVVEVVGPYVAAVAGAAGAGSVLTTVADFAAPVMTLAGDVASAMPVVGSVFKAVLDLVRDVSDLCEQATENKHHCSLVAQRLQALQGPLQQLDSELSANPNTAVLDTLNALRLCFGRLQTLVCRYNGYCTVRAKLQASAFKGEYEAVDKEISMHLQTLSLYGSKGLKDRVQALADVADDMRTKLFAIEAKLDEVLGHAASHAPPAFIISWSDIDTHPEGIIHRGRNAAILFASWYGSPVAVKKLYRESLDDRETRKLVREARRLNRLHSRFVVNLCGLVHEVPHIAVVMEYLPGGSLRSALHSGTPVSAAACFRVALWVAAGLAYLHSQQIAHGAVHSGNVLLDKPLEQATRAVLCDFGISITVEAQSLSAHWEEDDRLLPWRAPELLEPGCAATAASDVWAYGVLLWEMATGHTPFAGVSSPDIHDRIRAGDMPEFPAGVPEWYSDMAHLCWAPKPSCRPKFQEYILRELTNRVHLSYHAPTAA